MWLNVSSMRREKAKMISSWMKQESLKPFFGFLEIKVWDVIVCLKISGEIEAVWWQKPPQITQTSVVCRSFLQPNNSGAFKCGHNRLCWCFNNNRVNCRLHNNIVYICTVVLWREWDLCWFSVEPALPCCLCVPYMYLHKIGQYYYRPFVFFLFAHWKVFNNGSMEYTF